ncbi:MBL fold metallo-hydrolase [candidate division KSB1 bacterium]
MNLTSHGAALEVTGSQHLLEVNGKKILLDCGLFQGRRKEAFEKNSLFGFDPKEIDVMVLSHAHIDHSGNIPQLVKKGFQGVIYCTEATESLCEVMLLDSAYIQEHDAEYMAKKHPDTALFPNEPLYTIEDAEFSLNSFKGVPYNKTFELTEGVQATFREAGHVLGAALIVLDIKDKDDGKQKRLVFTGDLGRYRLPIIRDPYPIEKADYLLCESTYGNRTHDHIEEGISGLERAIKRTIKRGGKIIIPAFALERTQELIYALHVLIHEKKIPNNLPMFLDSPLATRVTSIFKKHMELYDKELKSIFKGKHNPFTMHQLKHTATVDDSKKLNHFIGPCVIISASGMCEAGRIRHHLKNNIEDPKNTIIVVGYMAENTLGRKIVDKEAAIKIFDKIYKVNAEVVILEAFSAHADMNDLDDYFKPIKGLKKVMLVHGEEDQSAPFAERLKKLTKAEVTVMMPQVTIDL